MTITGVFPKMSVLDLRTAAQQRADMVNSDFVTDAEWLNYLNGSYGALYDILAQKYGNEYFVCDPPYQFTTTGGSTDKFALPDDFYKLHGVDLLINGNTPNGWITLHPFNRADRNRFLYPNVQVTFGIMSNLRYRLYGGKLWLIPTPAAGQTVRVLYVPRVPVLTETAGTITLGSMSAGYTLTVSGTVLAYGTDFTTPGSLVSKLAALFPTWTLSEAAGVVSVLPDVPVSWATNTTHIILVPNTPARWATVADGFGGWLDYVVVDAARKALVKEESDVTALLQELAVLEKRIECAAENRDAGFPATVVDSTRSGNSGGWGWGDLGEPF